jgi:tetratricopeptide (TPR) repeat protein
MPSGRLRGRAARFGRAVLLTLLAPGIAGAQPPRPSAEATAQAHQHATHAHDLYQQGAYHEAITELETALKLDPNGKDLVFNLGVVHEKLGDIEDALRYFHRYETMDLDPLERAKADTYLKRLQGARKEVEKPVEPSQGQARALPPQPLPAPPPPEIHYGRFDWLTVTVAVIGVGGIAAGAYYGVKALADRPKPDTPTTSTDGYAQVENSELTAHNEAIISDVSFAVGAAGLAATAVLFFARTRDSAPAGSSVSGSAGPGVPRVVVSGTPLRGGGAVVFEARF